MEVHFILAVWFPVSVSHKYPFHRVGVPSLIWFSICMWMRFSRLDTTAGDTYLIRSLHRQSWWLRVWLPFLYTCSLILLLLFWLKFQARQSLSGPQTSCSASRTKPLHHPWVEASTDPVNEAAPISSVLIGEKAQLQKSCRNQRPGNDVCCQGLHIILFSGLQLLSRTASVLIWNMEENGSWDGEKAGSWSSLSLRVYYPSVTPSKPKTSLLPTTSL